MRNMILTTLGAAFLLGTVSQAAIAAEHHRGAKNHAGSAAAHETLLNANNAYAPSTSWTQPDVSRYQNGAASAPAGR